MHSSFQFALTHMKIATYRASFGDVTGRVVAGEQGIRLDAVVRITRPVLATGTYQPPVQDPFGSIRTAVELTATVDRREWGMDWQAPLPGGGDALGNDVTLSVHAELVEEG